MTCPNCGSKQPNNLERCSSCGQSFAQSEALPKKKKKHVFKRFKGLIIILSIILIFTVLIILLTLSANKGYRVSEKLSKKIGDVASVAKSSVKLDMSQTSAYSFINDIMDFSSISESDSKIDIYGVTFPAWAVYCTDDMYEHLSSVTYCDYRVLKSNINGIHKTQQIDISAIHSGMTEKEVNAFLDMKPYQIIYTGSGKSKKYKYYYKDADKRIINAYYITVIFDNNNKVNAPAIEEPNDFIYEIIKAEN